MHADMHEKQTQSVLCGVKALRGHVDASFSARVTRFLLSEAQIHILN